MKKKNKDYVGACIVLQNFLDGAVADYEQGDIDNVALIENCIEALYVLGDSSYRNYKDRMKKIIIRREKIMLEQVKKETIKLLEKLNYVQDKKIWGNFSKKVDDNYLVIYIRNNKIKNYFVEINDMLKGNDGIEYFKMLLDVLKEDVKKLEEVLENDK